MGSEYFDIITIGYIFNENIRFPDSTAGPFLGGTVSYSSVVLGRLGDRVGIVSNIGLDMPYSLLKPIYDSGVDTAGLHLREDSPTTTNILIYDRSGNKRIEYIKKAPRIVYEDIPDNYLKSQIVYFCPVDFDVLPETVAQIKKRGLMTAADMGGFGGAHSSAELQEHFSRNRVENLKAYARNIDIAKASMEDCRHLFGEDGFTEEEALQKLLDAGIKIAIMTMGEKGALIATKQDYTSIPPIPANVVDTTGAGDTFMAAFLSEYIKSKNLYLSGLFASATSSILIEKSGGVNIDRVPDREQVLKRLEFF